MKKIATIGATLLALMAVSCEKEATVQEESAPKSKGNQLIATFGEETKSVYDNDGYTLRWETGDKIVVNTSEGDIVFTYSGEPTEGAATFENEDFTASVTTGDSGYAVFQNQADNDDANMAYKDGKLQPNLASSYAWKELKAPMIARVTDTKVLSFKHLGGILKVKLSQIPPKAQKLVVTAPIEGSTHSYKVSGRNNAVYDLDTEQPYVKAYEVSYSYVPAVTLDFSSITEAERVNGAVFYVPLPVGPVDNKYPLIRLYMTDENGNEIGDTRKTARNVPIQRATVTQMPEIKLPKYTVRTIISSIPDNRTPHDIAFAPDGKLLVAVQQYHFNFVDVTANTITQTEKNSKSYPAYPYSCYSDGTSVWIANKVDASAYGLFKYNLTEKQFSPVLTGFVHPLMIKEYHGDVYLLTRGNAESGKIYVFKGGLSDTATAEVYADFSSVPLKTGYVWPMSFAFDTDGKMVVAVSASTGTPTECFKLYRVASQGATPEAIFGSGIKASDYAHLVDGPSAAASLSANMRDLEFDARGNLYIADQFTVRKLVRGEQGLEDGKLVTIVGSTYSSTEAVGAEAGFESVDGLAFDADYTHLYVSDQKKKLILKISLE